MANKAGCQLLADAISHLPSETRHRALAIGTQPPGLASHFESSQAAAPSALSDLSPGLFNFITTGFAFDDTLQPAPIFFALREATRLLRENGILSARFPKLFSAGELTDLARDLDFQVLAHEAITSRWVTIVWRKRVPGWRALLQDQAFQTTARVTSIGNAWDQTPVVPSRGRFAAISITVEALPVDADLFDLEIRIAGIRATAVSISTKDRDGQQHIIAQLPGLDQTGLIPVDVRWFGHCLGDQSHVRVVPPGPLVPRIASVAPHPSEITVSIEELGRPDELTGTLDGTPLWGLETHSTNSTTQAYDVRVPIPNGTAPGIHEIQLRAGHRKLAPFIVELG